ncbi:MAG: glycine--tRNA ligase subunit beta, partial [Pseudomonadota bacterium]
MQNNCANKIKDFLISELSLIAKYTKISTWCNLNRIGFHLQNISLLTLEKKGPNASIDQKIIKKFCLAHNIQQNELYIKTTNDKQSYYFKYTENIANIIQKIFKLPLWPERLKWPQSKELSWITPIRNILYINEKHTHNVIYFGEIKSNNQTISNNKIITIDSISNYFKYLQNTPIYYEQKLETITTQIHNYEKKYNIKCISNSKILEETINLNINPKLILGQIPSKFTTLPLELIQLTLEKNQRYLIFQQETSTNNQKISPIFGIITEQDKHEENILQGYIQVATARLEDALYLYSLDLKNDLFKKSELLKNIFINNTLGTLYDKIQRLLKLNNKIFEKEINLHTNELNKNQNNSTQNTSKEQITNIDPQEIETIIKIYKNDLTTNIIQEFPELQGVMGSYFAKHYHYNQNICNAIYNQYKTNINTDNYLLNFITILNNIDTIVGMFFSGHRPTSSKDPFALRRATNNLILCLEKYDIQLNNLIKYTIDTYEHLNNTSAQQNIADLIKFIMNNFINKYSKNSIKAIIISNTDINFKKLKNQLDAINNFNLDNILQAYKRINKLTEKLHIINSNPDIFKINSNNLNQEQIKSSLQENITTELSLDNIFNLYNPNDINLNDLNTISIYLNKFINNNFISNDNTKKSTLLAIKNQYFDKL